MTIENYREKINEIIESKMDEIRQEIATDFAYAILYNYRYEAHPDYDPPFDYLERMSTLNEKFNINNYNTLEDFLPEYNSNSMEIFKDEYLVTIYVKLSKYQEEYIREIFKNEEEKKNLLNALNIEKTTNHWFEIYDEYIVEILEETMNEHDILERFKKEKAKDLFNKGVSFAKEIRMEIEEDEERERKSLEMENKN